MSQKTNIFEETEERCFLMIVWLIASEFMSGYAQDLEHPCNFAYVEFGEKELEEIKLVKKLLLKLPVGSCISLPIKDSVIFLDGDTQPDEILETTINKIYTNYARLKANEDMSGYGIDGNKFVDITDVGVSFRLDEEIGTEQIAWDELNL